MDHSALLLGVDGGGSKTVACLAQSLPESVAAEQKHHRWEILGQGLAGSSNQQAVSSEQAIQALEEAIGLAFREAQLDLQPVQSVCLALAGCDRDTDKQFIQQWATRFIRFDHLSIVNDAVPLLVAGTPDQWGIALISGTGSFSWGRNEALQTARAGGWGYLMGDEGSGFSLGQAALHAATQCADGRGPQTTLLPALLSAFNCQEPQQLIAAVYGNDHQPTDTAALAPIVLEQVAADDEVALKLASDAASSLTRMVESVAQKLDIEQGFPLVFAGSLLTGSYFLKQSIQDQLQRRGLKAEPIESLERPVLGALQIAQQMRQA